MAEATPKKYAVTSTAPGVRYVQGTGGAVGISPNQPAVTVEMTAENYEAAQMMDGVKFEAGEADPAAETELPEDDKRPNDGTQADPVQTAPVTPTAGDSQTPDTTTDVKVDSIASVGFGKYQAYAGDAPVGPRMSAEEAKKFAAENDLEVPTAGKTSDKAATLTGADTSTTTTEAGQGGAQMGKEPAKAGAKATEPKA